MSQYPTNVCKFFLNMQLYRIILWYKLIYFSSILEIALNYLMILYWEVGQFSPPLNLSWPVTILLYPVQRKWCYASSGLAASSSISWEPELPCKKPNYLQDKPHRKNPENPSERREAQLSLAFQPTPAGC